MTTTSADDPSPRFLEPSGDGSIGSALRVGLLYLAFGAAWILLSDTLLQALVEDTGPWQTYKGLAFVLASAVVIYLLVRRELGARRQAEARREASERRYRTMFRQSVAGVFRTTLDGEILACNRSLAEMLGFEAPEELVGTNATAYYPDPEQRDRWIETLEGEDEIRNFELRLRRRDGTDLWVLMNASRVEEGPDAGPVLAGTMVDVTEEKQLRDELEAYAYHDVLTGLPNRRYLKQEADAVLSKAHRDGDAVGVLYLDLDRFKRINDTLGHDVGDDVLFQVGRRLVRHLREEDTAARIGGDEFGVLLNTIDGGEDAERAAERLHEALGEPFFAGDRSLHVSVSIGVAVYPDHGQTFAELLSRADRAMYQATEKAVGVVVFEGAVAEGPRDQIAEEEELREAIREGQLELHFQPIHRISTGEVVGAEALARWRHPDLGLRTPGAFIPVAEHTGLIRDIDLWAFRDALRQAERLTGNGTLEWLGVNVSAQSLRHDDVLDRFYGHLEDSDVADGGLIVEITESTAMQDPHAAVQVFRNLQRRGAWIAIDDFGTGHSALAYLKSLPANVVKLDMIFVQGVEGDDREDRLLKALVALGKTLDVEVVAEGVETDGQYRRLASHGCDLAQGYHLGRPMSLESFRESLDGPKR